MRHSTSMALALAAGLAATMTTSTVRAPDFGYSIKSRGRYGRTGGRNPAGTKIARKAANGQLTKR